MDKFRMIEAKDIWPGDYIDLEGDMYAGNDPVYEYEYGIVEEVEYETPNCIVVHFENFDSIGFPSSHKVKVVQV